jgi:hypothetical protein
MENTRGIWRATMRRIMSLAISLGGAGLLFIYLSETYLLWRISLSALLFLAAFIMIDSVLMRE